MRRSLAVWLGLGVLGVLAGACSALRDLDRLSAGASPDAGAARDTWRRAPGTRCGGDGGRRQSRGPGGYARFGSGSRRRAPPTPDAAPTSGVSAIYWLETGSRTVRRSGPNGEDPRVVLTLPANSFLRSIAVDDVHKKIYFSDSGTKRSSEPTSMAAG